MLPHLVRIRLGTGIIHTRVNGNPGVGDDGGVRAKARRHAENSKRRFFCADCVDQGTHLFNKSILPYFELN
jgi:hypothetical protein